MAADIYTQHDAAFAQVSAFVVLHKSEPVAKIAFKHPRDGVGRLYAYVHWIGAEMVRGFASGGGYDKRTAACASAAEKLPLLSTEPNPRDQFTQALRLDGGASFDAALRNAGFVVLQAV